jgi:cytochrome c oxidase subunit 2
MLAGATVGFGGAASAQNIGAPIPGAIGLQSPVTDNAAAVGAFHNEVLVIITAITIFVLGLLLWVMIRYNRKANPKPGTFSHNTAVEIVWTLGPVLILVYIAAKSFPLLYQQDVMPKVAESEIVDVKVYGRQWFWSYIYGEGDNTVEYDSNMVPDDQLKPGQTPKLSVDNPMVVPAGKHVRLSVTASDVIHSWAMPSFAAKIDAVPGRLNQIWFKVDEPGVFYGQCSELCGTRHAYMPIEVRVLLESQYNQWLTLMAASPQEARAYLDQVQPLAAQVASAQ